MNELRERDKMKYRESKLKTVDNDTLLERIKKGAIWLDENENKANSDNDFFKQWEVGNLAYEAMVDEAHFRNIENPEEKKTEISKT